MSSTLAPSPAAEIPRHALDAWRALAWVLAMSGPAPCERPGVADRWFPTPLADSSAAQQACRGCPARLACANYATVAGEREGVWGATRPEERR